jgi:hypothetical protein
MKKFVLALGAAAAIVSVTPAEAGFKGCCGGWNSHPHFGRGILIGLGLGVDPGFSVGYGGGCYYAYRKVLIPNIGIVMKKQLVCV